HEAKSMSIKKIEAIPISVPLKKPFVISTGEMRTLDHVIVKVHTDAGIVGVGESAPVPIFSEESQEDVKAAIDKYISRVLIGEDIFDIEKILEKMDKAVQGHSYAKAGIELALWDAMGKTLKVPVYKLLGGLYRENVPMVWIIGIGTPEQMADEAREYVNKGFSTLKVKIGIDPQQDVKNVAAVREAVGYGAQIRVDANQGYTADVAIKTLRKMERYDLELIEQPVPRWDLNGMAKVAKALDTPVMADESVFSPNDVIKIIQKEAADIINIKIMKPGGLYNAKRIASIAESAGIPCLVGSMIETGVGTMACAHFACSTKNIRYPCEFIGTMMIKDDILDTSYIPEDGFLKVPKECGFGVNLNEDKVRKYMTS
ncbi:MAG: enolase C-terminal domain-like protein, partial [Candidatus Bathyarchaeia archaeon]